MLRAGRPVNTLVRAGPDLSFCRELARRLDVDHRVKFFGAQPHPAVRDQMQSVRAVVHHSIVAASGDAEGTPVVVMEAGAS
jgi:glycosyltransferase involved in cell wall biosynthesis